MIYPTIGRKVWYRPSADDLKGGNEKPMAAVGTQPLDATVVAVWGDRCVNLVVFDANGDMFKRTSVMLLQDSDPLPVEGRYAEWMPYQTAQAAKAV